MSLADISSLPPPKGQNQEPELVLVEAVLAATLSVELSELQAASRHATEARIRIRMYRPYELRDRWRSFASKPGTKKPPSLIGLAYNQA
jgi:hypothetical protein